MLKIWFLSAAIVWFVNMSSQTIESENIRAGWSYYSLSDQFQFQDQQQNDIVFSVDGSYGLGLTLLTSTKEPSKWRHTLTLRRYQTSDYQISFYQTGFDYIVIRPSRMLQQFIGFDISVADMTLQNLKNDGSMKESLGYGVHFGLEGYFVTFEKLLHYFVSAGIRRQKFLFEIEGAGERTFNGNGLETTAGLGIRF